MALSRLCSTAIPVLALTAALARPLGAASTAPAPATALAAEGFSLIGEERGVRIHRREARPGIELAGEGTIAASPDRVRRVLLDYASHPRWNKHLEESRVLATSAAALDVYQRLNLPILNDRDYTLHVTWGADGDVLWVRFTTANERGPAAVKGVVRVTDHEGSWRFEPVAGGQATRVVYRLHMDLAGSFPAWIGKGRATKSISELFGNLEKQVPSYR